MTDAQLQSDESGGGGAVENDVANALRTLELRLMEKLHAIALEGQAVSGQTTTLVARFDSEIGHARRELGEALNNIDRQRDDMSSVRTTLTRVEGEVSTTARKMDKMSADVQALQALQGRVATLELKDLMRTQAESRRELNIRAIWAAILAAFAKFAFDAWPHK